MHVGPAMIRFDRKTRYPAKAYLSCGLLHQNPDLPRRRIAISLLFHNVAQARKVRRLLPPLAAALGACSAWIVIEIGGPQVVPAEIGGIALAARQIGAALPVVGASLVPIVAAGAFARCYVVRLEHEGPQIVLTTLGVFAHAKHRIATPRIARVTFHDGYLDGATPATPWVTLRVHGWYLPFVLDFQAETIDRPAIAALARGD